MILADAGIARLGEQQALHWMVTNIPGNAISEGSEVIQYLTPFSLELDEEGYRQMFENFDKDSSGQVSIDEFLFSVRVGRILP